MKKKKLSFLAVITIVCLFSLNSFKVLALNNSYGMEVPEMLELYEKYYDDDYESLYFEEATSEYSSYCVIQEMADVGFLSYYGDPDENINIADLRQISGYSEEELSLRCSYIERTENWSLRMQFLAHDHNANYEAALKIKETIAQNHDIKSAYIEVGEKCVIRSNRTCWNDIRRIDEFGIESPLTEELTSKQVSDLNLNIAKNNYEASIDEHTGNVVFAEGVTEKEKLEFAVWLKAKYGFYAYTYSAAANAESISPERKELYYTDIKGDVNNDGLFNVSDLVMLQKYLLGNGTLTNWKNGNLCCDDRIDVFDLILVRREFLESGSSSVF